MRKVLVFEYDEKLASLLMNERLVIKVDSLVDIQFKYKISIRKNEVLAMVVSLPYTSVSQLEFKLDWEEIPMVLELYNLGDYILFLEKVDIIKHLNIRILLNSKSESLYTDLKILASLGIDCGIKIESGHIMDDEKILDLASYYYMSPVPHATIEPFEYILHHVNDESNTNFNEAYFCNPLLYKSLFSIDDLEGLHTEENNEWEIKLKDYYSHFIQLDDCSKCPAFKICNKQMQKCLYDCQKTMTEIFELAELRNEIINNNKKVKTICQL